MSDEEPTPHELWLRAHGDAGAYRQLMVDYGHAPPWASPVDIEVPRDVPLGVHAREAVAAAFDVDVDRVPPWSPLGTFDRPVQTRRREPERPVDRGGYLTRDEFRDAWEAAKAYDEEPRAPSREQRAHAQTVGEKAAHVRRSGQTREHTCHWPGCEKQVPPARWGCSAHWFALPKYLRDKVWRAYRVGQEETLTPSREYLAVAHEVDEWIREHGAQR